MTAARLASLIRGLGARERLAFDRLGRGDGLWLAFAALAAVAFDYFRFPALFGEAGVFDDDAYWLIADRDAPFIRFLFLPDGHYLSLFSRAIVGIPLALGFQPDQVGVFLQSASSAARGLLLGVVLLSPFRDLLGPLGGRLVLFALLILFGDYQLRLVYNLGYAQIVFVFFALLLSLIAEGRAVAALLAVACLAALTKITVLVLLPIALVAIAFNRGLARALLAAMALGMIANLGVAITTGGFGPSDYTAWLVDEGVPHGERVLTALYLAPLALAFFAGFAPPALGLAGAALAGGVALAAAGLLAARRASAIVGLCLVATALGYAAGAAWSLTRVVNLKTLEFLGGGRYHLFPLYAIAAAALLVVATSVFEALLRGARAQRYRAAAAGLLVFAVFFAGGAVQRGMTKRDAAYHLLTGAGYWRDMAALLDADASADFCVAVPNTFPYLVGPKGGCPLLYAEPIRSRAVAAPVEGHEKEIAIDVTAVAGPPRKVIAFGIFLRAAGFIDESMRFTITLQRGGGREEFEAIRTVKAAGSFAYFHLPTPVADATRITIRPHGAFLVMVDEASRKPWIHVWGSVR